MAGDGGDDDDGDDAGDDDDDDDVNRGYEFTSSSANAALT
jgi:hypothetical protein